MDISKLCRNDEEKMCVYCAFSIDAIDENSVICRKKGMVFKTGSCRKYKYDPLKRRPPSRVRLRKVKKMETFD